jgi:putative DNA primase/helicase
MAANITPINSVNNPQRRPSKAPEQPRAIDELLQIRTELCTEAFAAQMFYERYGDLVSWAPGLGWLVWTGKNWKPDTLGQVTSMLEVLGEMYRAKLSSSTCEAAQKIIGTWAKRMESASGIKSVKKLVQHRVAKPAEKFDVLPLRVNFNNCTLHFHSEFESMVCQQETHCQGDNLTKIIPHDRNMGALCPRWLAFLEDILPDPEVRAFVQRAVGYSLLGTTKEQCFFICWGDGCNGKSTFLNTLQRVIGPGYAALADPKTFMQTRNDGIRNDIAALRGVRFLIAIETGDGHRLDEGLVKQATGGDPMRARHLYQEAFEFTPSFKLWLCTNHKPRIRGTDLAIWRRVRLIPFTETIAEEKRDPDLENLLRREAEGILAWAVRGAEAYMRAGLQAPDAVKAATEAYRGAEDEIGLFIEACTFQGNATVGATELYEGFLKFTGSKLSQRRFGERLVHLGYERSKTRNGMVYMGLGLLMYE